MKVDELDRSEEGELVLPSNHETYELLAPPPQRRWLFHVPGTNVKFAELTVDADGRVSVLLAADVDVTVMGGMHTHVGQSRLDTTEGNAYALTGGHHHTNPSDFEAMARYISPRTPWASSLMAERAKLYAAQDEASRKRGFYVAAARRALLPKRPKKRGKGCGC